MGMLFSVLLALWVAPQPAAQAPAQPDAQQSKILALENAWNQAEEHKDVKALDSLIDASLVYIDIDGSLMNKAQFIASVQAPSEHPEQIVNESMTSHVYGDNAVVTGVYRDKGITARITASRTSVAGALLTPGSTAMGTGCAWPASSR